MADAGAVETIFATAPLVPQRAWLEALAIAIPGATATRYLLLVDVVCLVGIALAWRPRWFAVPVAVVLGFILLNALGLLLNDFFLALALFHVLVALTTLGARRSVWWLGASALGLSLSLGVLT